MLNENFKTMNLASRYEKLRNIITAKARNISYDHIEDILDEIDIEKQYTITGTNDFKTMLRNAYNEDGGETFQVNVYPVYGNLSPGFVADDGNISEAEADDVPTAFIKETTIYAEGHYTFQNSIFIYQKRDPYPDE